jgi:hypothetical protein
MPLVRAPAEFPDRVAVTALRRLRPRRVIGRIRPLPSAGGRSPDWGAGMAGWLAPRIALHLPRTRVRIPLLLRGSRPPDGANGSLARVRRLAGHCGSGGQGPNGPGEKTAHGGAT